MSWEASPVNVRCNLDCSYCYQKGLRDTGQLIITKPDIPAMLQTLSRRRADESFSLFGGEALMAPLSVLEELWKASFEKNRSGGVQTNGALITDAHIELFKKYAVHVGFSIDGPEELNDARQGVNPARTREMTDRSNAALQRLLKEGIGCGLILTLSRANCTEERLPRLLQWLQELDALGLKSALTHVMEADTEIAKSLVLTDQELLIALESLRELEITLTGLRFKLFEDIRSLLLGKDGGVGCVWTACDPASTPAVQSVLADGTLTNCQRTYKDGTIWLKSEGTRFERQIALRDTPYEDGGCKDCRLFIVCKGQCPGEALDGDYRNRSQNCRAWFALISHIEHDLIKAGLSPVTLRPDLKIIENRMMSSWARGESTTIESAVSTIAHPASGKGPWYTDSDARR